jgi:POT family proton-dependent oligopeptide transporter
MSHPLWLREIKSLPSLIGIIYLLKVLESFSYYSTALNLTVFLSEEHGFTDEEAGVLYGAWGVASGIAGGIFGPTIDSLGVRTSLTAGGLLLALGRAMLAGARTRTSAMFGLFVLQSVGTALAIPVLMIAVRRLSNETTSSIAFGLFYSCMNIGSLVSGATTDMLLARLRQNMSEGEALRVLLWIGTGTTVVYTFVAGLCVKIRAPPPREEGTLWTRIKAGYQDPLLWRVCAFSGALFGTSSIFRHIDATLPKWLKRTIGPTAHYGAVYSINPAIVIVSVPLASVLLRSYSPYEVVLGGSVVASAAPLVLGLLSPSYAAAATFMVVVSVGETLYSPKAMEFIMSLAPHGQEGLFGTLAGAPIFAVKLLTGWIGGKLLGTYCPRDPPRQCQEMWLWIAVICFTTPILLVWLRGFIVKAEPAPVVELDESALT